LRWLAYYYFAVMNPAQKITIEKNYLPLVDEFDLPLAVFPTVPRKLTDQVRRKEILDEIEESRQKYWCCFEINRSNGS
jgi:hypothetical protein